MKKGLKITALVLGSIVGIYAILALFPRPDNHKSENNMRKDGEMPILIAHGGGNKWIPM